MGRQFPTLVTILIAVLAFELPGTADAQGDDKAYCAELSSLYRRYIQNAPGRRSDVEAARALEDCQKGNTAAAIQVLERRLRENGFSLPKEFRP